MADFATPQTHPRVPTPEAFTVSELASRSGVGFGTSGARGLVTQMTDLVCYSYAAAFLRTLIDRGSSFTEVAVGGDLRPSSPRITHACARAAIDLGLEVTNFGAVPSPALAQYGIEYGIPTIMVTGSHIPDDRNGIKFTTAAGEITKKDEQQILAQKIQIPAGLFDAAGAFTSNVTLPAPSDVAHRDYLDRLVTFFKPGIFTGCTVGVYQHSAVMRDLMPEILSALGATVILLGRSETFIPVDTEAIRPEDVQLGMQWAREHTLHAIVSADGDSDRPLVADESGRWFRGDVAGILTAQYLGATAVAAPVSCNTALERCGSFSRIARTKIGSPFVIEAMEQLARQRGAVAVGYEANGGFLTASRIERNGRELSALPTRDSMIVALSILALAAERGCAVSELSASLPPRFTASDRMKEFPTEKSRAMLAELHRPDKPENTDAIRHIFGALGSLDSVDATDGLRMTFGELIVHLRPSGNAPEFRCYTEAPTQEGAEALNRRVLGLMRQIADRYEPGIIFEGRSARLD